MTLFSRLRLRLDPKEQRRLREREIFQPYLIAIQNILEGVLVLHLDRIRQEVNNEWSRAFRKYEVGREVFERRLLVTYGADAENKILMGKDPEAAYEFLALLFKERKIEEIRILIRTVIQNEVNNHGL